MWLFSGGSLAVVCSPIPGDLERKDGHKLSMALALVQKPEGFHGWWGNVAREAPGGWALNLLAEFPSLITHLLQASRRSREQGTFLYLIPGQGLLAGGAWAWCLCILTCLNTSVALLTCGQG